MKRLISFVLCFCVLLSYFELSAFAVGEAGAEAAADIEQKQTYEQMSVNDIAVASSSFLMSGDFHYLITGPDTCKITGHDGMEKVLVFPSQLDGYKVTSIGEFMIYNLYYMEELVIPDSVKSIDGYAFYRCYNLKKVTLPEGLESIGEGAFSGCRALEEINIPETVTYFGADIFKDCDALKNKYASAIKADITTGEEYLATIELPDLYNLYYTFTPSETRTYIFESYGNYDTAGYIYDSYMNLLASDDNNGDNDNFSVSYIMEAGKTYILSAGMLHNVGSFTIKVEPSHEFESRVETPATCSEEGVVKYSCKYCDYYYTGSIPYTHNYSTADSKTYTCSNCGDSFTVGNKYLISDTLTRIKGKNRYETSLEICHFTKESMGIDKFESVIIASGENFADALAGSYLAKVKNAPIIMASGKDANNREIKNYLDANLSATGNVYILGGTAAVPQSTEDMLAGYNVKRIKGKTRYDTNIEILKEAGVTNQEIIVATGTNFADSLSASAVGKPILLVDGKKGLTDTQKNYLDGLSTEKFYIIGGTGAVGENFETEFSVYGTTERIKGKTRYETSVAIAEKFFTAPSNAVLAYAENFPDGLSGGPLAMSMNAPLILTKTGKQSAAKDYVQNNDIENGIVLGGASLIDDSTATDIFTPESKCPECGSEEHTVHPAPNIPQGKLSVVLVCSELGDKSFNDSADAGLQKMENNGTVDYNIYEYGWDNSKVYSVLENVANDYDIVICNNLGYGMAAQWLRLHAAQYPDTTFILYDESVDIIDNVPNVQMIAYKSNEGDFLAGALAAFVSETGVIGFTGGMESPVVHDFMVGYIEGAKYVNPDIKVKVSFVGSYTDAAKGKDLGLSAIWAGADVLHHVAGSAGNGYLEAASESGIWGIGVDFDYYEVFKKEKPNYAKAIITSSIKVVGKSLQTVIGEIVDGSYQWSQIRWFGVKEYAVKIAENENYLANVSLEDQTVINDIKAKISSGEIVVPSAYDMSADEINAIINSVK